MAEDPAVGGSAAPHDAAERRVGAKPLEVGEPRIGDDGLPMVKEMAIEAAAAERAGEWPGAEDPSDRSMADLPVVDVAPRVLRAVLKHLAERAEKREDHADAASPGEGRS